MGVELTQDAPSVVDVTGLSPEAVQAVQTYVAQLRAQGSPPSLVPILSRPWPTDEEFDRGLREIAAFPPVPALPADWSRADLYDDHD